MPGSQSDFGQRLGAVVVAHSRAHQGLCRAPGDALYCSLGAARPWAEQRPMTGACGSAACNI